MVSLPVKALIGLGVAGAIGGGGYGIHVYVSGNKTLADSLKSQGFVLLDVDGATDDTTWAENVTSHESTEQSLKLSGYTKVETENKEEVNKKAMKDACKNLLSTLMKNKTGNMEEQAKKWCVKKTTTASVA